MGFFSKKNLRTIVGKFRDPTNILLFLLISTVVYHITAILESSRPFTSIYSTAGFSGFIPAIFETFTVYPRIVPFYIFGVTIATSLLIGLNIVLLAENLTFSGITATPGAAMGMVFTGCPACTAGVMSVAGFSIGLSTLPLSGLELNLFGVLLLVFSALYIASRENKKVCSVDLPSGVENQ